MLSKEYQQPGPKYQTKKDIYFLFKLSTPYLVSKHLHILRHDELI